MKNGMVNERSHRGMLGKRIFHPMIDWQRDYTGGTRPTPGIRARVFTVRFAMGRVKRVGHGGCVAHGISGGDSGVRHTQRCHRQKDDE